MRSETQSDFTVRGYSRGGELVGVGVHTHAPYRKWLFCCHEGCLKEKLQWHINTFTPTLQQQRNRSQRDGEMNGGRSRGAGGYRE